MLFSNFAYFTITDECASALVFRADHFITSRRKKTSIIWKIILLYIYKTGRNILCCVTCTVIGYPCFNKSTDYFGSMILRYFPNLIRAELVQLSIVYD